MVGVGSNRLPKRAKPRPRMAWLGLRAGPGLFFVRHADAYNHGMTRRSVTADRMVENSAVTQHEVKIMIRALIDSSVIHGHVNASGVSTDLNGNPLVSQGACRH